MLVERLRRARQRGVPLVAVETADQEAAVALVAEAMLNADGDRGDYKGARGLVAWDVVRGPRAARDKNDDDKAAFAAVVGQQDPAAFVDLPTFLDQASRVLPKKCGVVLHNVTPLLLAQGARGAQAVQAVANLRGPFASRGSTCVMLCESWIDLPGLGADVHVLDDPLPDDAAREEVVREQVGNAGLTDVISDADVVEAVRRTRGLSRFVVEQTVALSLEPTGLDREELLRRFVAAVNATPGLTYRTPDVTLDDIGGLDNIKAFFGKLAGAQQRFDAVIFVDEIEKMISGVRGDLSGTSQSIFGKLLTYMQEVKASGLIALGPPGAGKSMSAVAAGAALDVPTIAFDSGDMKGSLVGQSEAQSRAAFRALKSLAPRALWIATCNSDAALPPELMRRFGYGTWYFDLPSDKERDVIWKLYGDKYGVKVTPKVRPADAGWTGAEIETCCRTASNLGITIEEASQWIVPVAVRAAEQIDALRRLAHNRYVSASAPGPYQYTAPQREASEETRRSFDFGTPDKEVN